MNGIWRSISGLSRPYTGGKPELAPNGPRSRSSASASWASRRSSTATVNNSFARVSSSSAIRSATLSNLTRSTTSSRASMRTKPYAQSVEATSDARAEATRRSAGLNGTAAVTCATSSQSSKIVERSPFAHSPQELRVGSSNRSAGDRCRWASGYSGTWSLCQAIEVRVLGSGGLAVSGAAWWRRARRQAGAPS